MDVNILLHQLPWSRVGTPNLTFARLCKVGHCPHHSHQMRTWHSAHTLSWDRGRWPWSRAKVCPQGARGFQAWLFFGRTSLPSMRSGTFPVRPRTQRTSARSPTSPRTCRPATTIATFSAQWTWWVESRSWAQLEGGACTETASVRCCPGTWRALSECWVKE